MKINVATVEEALRKKERQGEIEETVKMSFLRLKNPPLLNANVLFVHVFVESHPVYEQT